MNYINKFGIEFNPFIKQKHDTKLDLAEYKQLIYRLKHLEEVKGIGVITGEPGLGKTTSVRYWTKSLNKNLYKIVYIQHTSITVHEFYRQLCEEFGLEVSYSKRKNFNALQDEIKRLIIEKRITPVIILDEANYLSSHILNDLKMILNFEMDSQNNMILLLVGQKTLLSTLSLKSNEALKQRISMNYNLQPMTRDETKYYIDQKLAMAGLNTPLMSIEAYNQIAGYSNGVPRVINQIMDKALLLLENCKRDSIDEEIAMSAISEVNIF